jgi:hypothetical protein
MSGAGPTDMSPEDWQAEVFAAAQKFSDRLMAECFTGLNYSVEFDITAVTFVTPPRPHNKITARFRPNDPSIKREVKVSMTSMMTVDSKCRVFSPRFVITATDQFIYSSHTKDSDERKWFDLESYYAYEIGPVGLFNTFQQRDPYGGWPKWETPDEFAERILPLAIAAFNDGLKPVLEGKIWMEICTFPPWR